MANEIIRELNIDVAKANTFQAILAAQYDRSTRYILATITNLGVAIEVDSASVVTINFSRPHEDDADTSDYQAAFTGSVVDGKVKVPLPYWALERDGEVTTNISMVASDGRLSTLNFTIKVTPAPYSGEDISDDDNYDILLQLLTDVSTAKSEAEQAAEAAANAAESAESAYGNSIASTVITYQASTDGTTPPTGTWQTSIPTVSAGNYLWTKILITFNDGSTASAYSVAKQGETGEQGEKGDKGDAGTDGKDGVDGQDGADGTGIGTFTISYAVSASGTETPTEWNDEIPTVDGGCYLWTKINITLTDGTSQVAYSVAKQGSDGVAVAASGYVMFSVDDEGNLWCEYSDSDETPSFEYDSDSGNLYYVIS